ncbi:MAG: preprotein translocase subunit SecE [Bacteroidetes bacterium]|nr:MAG: preprotein translocase subunit SecE [Bacteroidota bacterium]
MFKKIFAFFNDSKTEMLENVTWTKLSDLQNNSVLVLVGTLIFALFIGAIDIVFDKGLGEFYKSFQ